MGMVKIKSESGGVVKVFFIKKGENIEKAKELHLEPQKSSPEDGKIYNVSHDVQIEPRHLTGGNYVIIRKD